MPINAVDSSDTTLTSALNSTSNTLTPKLTEEEKLYDTNQDGILSIDEKAKMLAAEAAKAAQAKANDTIKNATNTKDSLEISQEALALQKQNEKRAEEKRIEDQKEQDKQTEMTDQQRHMNEAIAEYKKIGLMGEE